MGGAMAANLARRGFAVRGWNRSPNTAGVAAARAGGVPVVATIAEAVGGAAFVCLCVSDVPDVEAVLFAEGGVVEHARRGVLVIDFSTIGPVAAREFGARLAGAGLRFVDAPVTGGDVGARAATLTVMAGGSQEDYDEAAAVFDAVGKRAVRCGGPGDGQAVKLCNQVLAALHMVALTEAVALARLQGIDPSLVVDVCKSGAAGSWALEHLGAKAIAGDHTPGFMIKHLVKDLRLAMQAPAGAGSQGLLGTELAKTLFERVVAIGRGDAGTQALSLAYSSRR